MPRAGGLPERVRLTQTGQFRARPGGGWLRFKATQELSVREVAFAWRARFRRTPVVWLDVVDSYEAGRGSLAARLWGLIRVMRAEGPEMDEGEAMRYLAELPWVPYAMLGNDSLEWHAAGEDAVGVRTRVGASRVGITLHLDGDGDIVAASTPARPRTVRKQTLPTPWRGTYSDYAELGGVRIPTRAEVEWTLPTGRFTYFRGTVTSFEAI